MARSRWRRCRRSGGNRLATHDRGDRGSPPTVAATTVVGRAAAGDVRDCRRRRIPAADPSIPDRQVGGTADPGVLAWHTAILIVTYRLAIFLFAPLWGCLSDRYGRQPLIVIGVVGFASTLVMFAMAGSLSWPYFGRFLNASRNEHIRANLDGTNSICRRHSPKHPRPSLRKGADHEGCTAKEVPLNCLASMPEFSGF